MTSSLAFPPKKKVLMLLYTTYQNDARVDRCAKTLAKEGAEVLILAKHRYGLPVEEEVNGYRVLRLQWDGDHSPHHAERWQQDFSLIRPKKKALLGGDWGTRFFAQANSPEVRHGVHLLYRADLSLTKAYKKVWQLCSPGFAFLATLALPYIALTRKNPPEWADPATASKCNPLPPLLSVEDDEQFWRRRIGYYRYADTCRQVAEEFQPDVLHAHDFNTLLAAYEVKKKLDVPFVYDSHELWVHRNRANVEYSKLEQLWEEKAEKMAMKEAAFSITVCDSIADHLQKAYNLPKLVVLRNTPERETNLRTEERSIRSELGINKDALLTIYVGRITFYRGVEDIIRALPYMDEQVKFVTLGYFDQRFEPEYQALVDELGVRDRVYSFGPVPVTEVADWIKEVDISFTTMSRSCLSYVYTLPNKLFESLQAEVPIIGPDSPEICRVVDEFNCGMTYRDGDPKHLAEQVNTLIQDDQLLQQFREGTKTAAQELCWDNERSKLIDAYNKYIFADHQGEHRAASAG